MPSALPLVALQDDFFEPLFDIKYLVGDFYLIFSFILEIAGLMAIIGILLALWRRYVVKPKRLDSKPEDAIILLWILVVLVTGFLVEGARIAATRGPNMKSGALSDGLLPVFLGAHKRALW